MVLTAERRLTAVTCAECTLMDALAADGVDGAGRVVVWLTAFAVARRLTVVACAGCAVVDGDALMEGDEEAEDGGLPWSAGRLVGSKVSGVAGLRGVTLGCSVTVGDLAMLVG